MATSLEFKIPADPSPMPTMGSDDEESFVVLGKSLIPDVDLSFRNLHIEPVQSGPIEEGKKLINMELSQLDTSILPQMPDVSQQINNSDTTISLTTISTGLSPEEVQQKVDSVIAENIKLRDTIITNNTAMELQHERIIAWKEEVQKTHQAHKLKFAEAKEFITKLKSEKDLLTFELEKSNEIRGMQQAELLKLRADLAEKNVVGKSIDSLNTGENTALINTQKELINAKNKITELEKLLQIIHVAKDKVALENEQLKQKNSSLSNTEQIIQELKNELQDKEKIIEELKIALKNIEQSSSNTIRILNTDIINLRSQLCLNINLQEDLDNVRKQLMASQASITALQQAHSVLTAQFTAEQEKVKELKKLESIKDDYFALQEQIEIYKADFGAERDAKEFLKAEKDQIISDFLQIQKRNNELNEELELIKERGFEVIGRRENLNSMSSPNSSTESSQERRYTCPICNFGFSAYQALENHVERCMDLSASLP